MKKRFTVLTAAVLLFMMIFLPWNVAGETRSTSSLTFTAACGGSGTADDGAVYTVTSDASESNYDPTKGIHYGTGKLAVSYLTLTTDDIEGTITQIVVNASGASGTSAKLNVTVGGAAFGSEKSLTSSAAEYTFTGSASGTIVVSSTQTSATKALYCKSIVVTYTSGSTPTTYTVTYDANGGTGTMTDSDSPYNAGATVTVLANTFTRDNYTFTNWNTAANGSGTSYDAGHTFTINANTTLYAQWTENGGGGSNTQTLTFDVSSNPGGWPTTNSTTLTNYTYTLNSVDYTFALKNVKCNSGYLMVTSVGVVGLPAIEGYKLTEVVASNSSQCSTSTKVGISSSSSSASYISGGANQTWSTTSSSYTYVLTSTEVNTMYYLYVTNKNAQVTQLELTYEYVAPSTDPAINVDSELTVTPVVVANGELAVSYNNIEPTSGTITLFDAQDNEITSSCTWFIPAFNTDLSKVTYTATDNTTGAVNSLRMHLAVTDGNKNATADVAVSQDFILTTMDQVLARATANGSTEKDATIRLTNWVISEHNGSHTSSTGYQSASKEWITDATGTKGCVIYGSSPYAKFNIDDVLNGTVTCKLKLFTGFSQISSASLNSQISDLTVTNTPGTVVAHTTTIDALGAVNTGSLVTINGLTYNGSTLTDGTNSITPTSTLYSSMSFSSNTTYNVTGIFEYYISGNTVTKKIYPRSSADISEVTIPAISVTSSLSGFTYCVGEGPSEAQTITVSGSNLEGNITLALNDVNESDFEISLDEDDNYTNTLTLAQTRGTVGETTIYVRMKAGLAIANDYADEINLSSTNATAKTVSLAGTVTPPVVTWDLTTNSYSSASATEVDWTSSYVNMILTKGTSGTAANNALGGNNYNHTRFYQNQNLTFTPQSGYAISSIVITAVSGNVAGFTGNTWTNATAETSGTTVTITPTNGNNACSVVISAACRATAVTVYYTASTATPHAINLDVDMEDGTVVRSHTEAIAGATVTLNIYPAAGYYLEDDDDIEVYGTSTVTLTKVNAGTYSFVMPDEDVTVYAIFSAYSGTYYTLVNSTADLIPGRHYIIASSKDAGAAYAMGAQNGNYRDQVAVNVVGNYIYGTPSGLREVVLSGDNTNFWTLYDDGTGTVSKGYLYAGTGNALKCRTDNTSDNNGKWTISITEGVATIVSQISGTDVSNTIKHNVGSSRFSCYTPSSGMNLVYLYMKADETDYEFYSKTTLSESNIITVPANSILTVNAGTLTNANPAYLIIKDGGQLKIYDNGAKDGEVQATLEKNIEKYTADNNGWNFIASPINVDNLAPTDVTNMLSNAYDLYQLNDTKWENYKEHEGNTAAGFSLANGRGYLYANSTDVTLSFAGAIKPFNSENPSANRVSVNAGWNLIGNPYTFDVYVNQPYYSISQAQTGITASTVAGNATAIKPCTGILVYAKSDDYVVEFSENKPDASTGNHGNIQMTLAHNVATRDGNRSETIDNAIVSFNEDAHLEKFYFGEPEANIYIPQNGRDYAIAFSNRQGDVPLNFRTNKISTYTISFEGEEMNLNGVYLIDMLEEEEIDLGTTPSYTFLGSPSDKAARFKIVFRNTGDDADSDIFAYQNGTDIIVSGEGELQIFDVMGRKVSSQRINGVETMCTSSLQNGVYVFRLNEKTQKIVVR